MNFTFSDLPNGEPGKGLLQIQPPHWAAAVRISNSDFEPVLASGLMQRDARSETGYAYQASLPPGTYEVKVTLEGRSASAWVAVDAGKISTVAGDTWKGLAFTSASPLKEIANFDQIHTDRARQISRLKTDKNSTGDSCMFLFVRCPGSDPESRSPFDGLELLDESTAMVSDFSHGVQLDQNEGWMAYRADLPSGGYILRRGRRGVRLRYQPFYLCQGWETQIFLSAAKYPSLSTWSHTMVRTGAGFRPDSDVTLATEAITDGLRYSSDSQLLLENPDIARSLDVLLDGKIDNPWLGVLAAHVIARFDREARSLKAEYRSSSRDDRIEQEIDIADQYGDVWKEKVRSFLIRTVGEHPDVRALMLGSDAANGIPFSFPPTLIASLQIVQAHALRNAETIPAGSLMDRIEANVLTNSPWTAWRRLDERSEALDPEALANVTIPRAYDRMRTVKRIDQGFSVSSVLSQTVVPRTPVYRLAELDPETQDQPAPQTVMQDAAMIQKSKELVLNYAQSFDMESMPKDVIINSQNEITSLLSVEPEKVSESFGIPLAKTIESIESLRTEASELGGPPQAAGTSATAANSSVQQAVLEYALCSPDRVDVEPAPTLGKYVLREIVIKILSEADRMVAGANGSASPTLRFRKEARGFAARLYGLSDELLKYADFVALTDSRGKILYSNGTFLLMISPRSIERSRLTGEELNMFRLKKQRSWEKVLVDLENGVSQLENPRLSGDWRYWRASRTQINDESTDRSSCFLNLLRLADFPPLTEEQLEKASDVAGGFSLYVPMWMYGTEEHFDEYIERIEVTIRRLEEMTKTWRK